MRGAEKLPVIVVVLQANLGEFAWEERQLRGKPIPFTAKRIAGVEGGVVAGDVIAAQADVPACRETVEDLRVDPTVADGFPGQRHGRERVGGGAEAAIQRLGLPRDERKSLAG